MEFQKALIMSVACSEEALQTLRRENKRVLNLTERPIIIPEMISLSENSLLLQRLEELRDYDVVEFYSEDKFHVYYRAESNDNYIMVTTKCNSNCIMCPMPEPVRKGPSFETIDHICELIDYYPSDTPFLTITGGEPTMVREELFVLLDKINSHFEGTKFFLFSNGRTLSIDSYYDEIVSRLPEEIRFGIPLYGYDSSSHDIITQSPGSFDQAVKAIHRLSEEKCEVEIRIVVSRLNAVNMTKIAKFITESFKGITCVNIMAAEICGAAAANLSKVWLDYKECFNYSKEAIQILLGNCINTRLYNFPLCKVDREYWSLCSKSISDYKIKYYDDCMNCAVKHVCGGVFGSTLSATKMQLNPIEEIHHA